MLQISNIFKQYKTGELVQKALDDVSLTLRDNEFVAILGPSGSGKTTLLNIIGGLDRYDSGDLIINGISTKNYKDRDWDSYRNHTIGFVFQSYNLIPHQSVLSNVELALTISGISKSERRKRAKEALEKVGLGEQLHKKPNQMSGGQMQRVAIARALVNDPDILLADEPTGALDSETSVQVMNLLKEVAKDRLVVMVTHNPELAEEYANRIIKLKDGLVREDSNPYVIDSKEIEVPKHKNMGKSSMSWLTALSLSFNNLKTKKGRTFLTAFAGSIGIIGIALILSLSNGVNTYITDIQKSTMSSYPIEIQSQTMDLSSLMEMERPNMNGDKELDHDLNGVFSNTLELKLASTTATSLTKNNLSEFKKYLDNKDSEIHQNIGENGIVYSYNTKFDVLTYDPKDVLVNTNGSTLNSSPVQSGGMMGMGNMAPMMGGSSNNFQQILPGSNGELISKAITDNYDLLHGQWPTKYDEVVLILDKNNEISATKLYQIGLLPTEDYKEIMQKLSSGEEIETKTHNWTYEEILSKEFYMIPASDYYVEDENGNFKYVGNDKVQTEELMKSALKLKVSGIIRIQEDAQSTFITQPLGYTKALTDYIIEYTDNSPVVKAQKNSLGINVTNGMTFAPSDDKVKIADAKEYFANLGVTDKSNIFKDILKSMATTNPEMAGQMAGLNETQMAQRLDVYLQNPEDDVLLSLYDSYISSGTYDENMTSFGVVSLDAPTSISIYADSFEDKDLIAENISKYNETVSEEDKIVYTDFVALLMSSVTTIIDVISYVLVAFVAVSLIVSSIMIGIITYISVLERTKEIGILRAMGASKSNISQVFNAETFIVGLFAGLLGVGISALLLIPGNEIIQTLTNNTDVKAILPPVAAVVLVILSVILTLIGGFIPAKKAAKQDPVVALRTE